MISPESEIRDTVSRIVAEVCMVPPETVYLEAKITDLSEDSIQLFELLLAFEKHYGLEADYEIVMQLETVSDIVTYVNRALIT